MIGGYDFVLPGTPRDNSDLWYALLCVCNAWPGAVFHGTSDNPQPVQSLGELLKLQDLVNVDLSPGREVFIYRDCAAADAWEHQGATDENAPSMIHIIKGEETLTLVADAVASEAGQICAQIQAEIIKERLREGS